MGGACGTCGGGKKCIKGVGRKESNKKVNSDVFLTVRHSIELFHLPTLMLKSPLLTGVLCSRLQRATIPDAVRIQFVLLKMGILMLETCRG